MLTILAALLATAQAVPLDPNLACIVDRLSGETRAAILVEASTGNPGAARDSLRSAAGGCAQERGWSDDHTRNVGTLAAALVLGEEAGAVLERSGIPLDLVDGWFDSQSRQVQTTAEVTPAVGEQLAAHLANRGVALDSLTANSTSLGVYLAARIQIERIADGMTD